MTTWWTKKLGRALVAAALVTLLGACSDDGDGGGETCEGAEDCPQIECDDGSTSRVCINGQCASKADVCESGGGGW